MYMRKRVFLKYSYVHVLINKEAVTRVKAFTIETAPCRTGLIFVQKLIVLASVITSFLFSDPVSVCKA